MCSREIMPSRAEDDGEEESLKKCGCWIVLCRRRFTING